MSGKMQSNLAEIQQIIRAAVNSAEISIFDYKTFWSVGNLTRKIANLRA
jgi:hypothetical protein